MHHPIAPSPTQQQLLSRCGGNGMLSSELMRMHGTMKDIGKQHLEMGRI